MLYQCNVIVTCSVVIFGAIFLVHYVINHHYSHLFRQQKSCESGFNCIELYLKGPPTAGDETMKEIIKELIIPPPKDPVVDGFNIYAPVWRKLVDWYKVQEGLIDAFKDQPPGVFVEVGAVDGDFMSQTLYLEKNLSWTGLLIEPDPRSFKQLAESGRNAWLSPICVNYGTISVRQYWLRTLEAELPHHFTQLLMARSKLNSETSIGDEERGTSTWVPCMMLSVMLDVLNMKSIDMLSIATGTDDDVEKIRDVILSRHLQVKTLLVHYPTSVLLSNPYPNIRGYIMDVERSQLLVKFYVKKSSCTLLSSTDCTKGHFYDLKNACYTYFCFEYLTVKAFA